MTNRLKNLHLAFIGCGVMGESMLAGLVVNGIVDAANISASHPREDRRADLAARYGIRTYESNAEAARELAGHENSAVVLCVKPQRLKKVLADLDGVIHVEQLVVSIVAGATITHLGVARLLVVPALQLRSFPAAARISFA